MYASNSIGHTKTKYYFIFEDRYKKNIGVLCLYQELLISPTTFVSPLPIINHLTNNNLQ